VRLPSGGYLLDACAAKTGRSDTSKRPRGQRRETDEGQAAYRKRKWIAEPPNGWIKERAGVSAVQHAAAAPGAS
jgi:hypothetical protein